MKTMKLTAPCVFGSLLAFLGLSWIKADEEVVLKGQGFGPCIATLRPERACSPGQHDATCPYLLHLPPLTVNLPPQFQELEKIMQDLQKLKESVDELREMCANCTVSQTGGECGRQSGEREKMTAGKGTREDERNWVRVIFEENDGDFREECGKEKKTEKTHEDNTDDRLIREGMKDRKSEPDKISDKKEIKEKETIKEDTRIYDADLSEEEKYTQKYTKTKETDGINVSVNQENWEETFGDGVKVNKNNEKPEQTELTENEKTIKEMGLDEKSRKIGKEIKTESGNGDEDGELSSSKTTERADFVSISPTPQIKMRTASRADSMDSRKVRTFTSSLPLPPFPSFTLSSITDVSQSTAAGHGPTQSTGPNTAGVPGPRSFDADLTTDRSTTTTVGGPGLKTIPNLASTGKLEGQLQGIFSTSTTTPTIINWKLYMTTSPRAEDDNNWKPKSPGKRPQPGRELHPGKKYPLGTKPEANINLKKPPNKPDKAQLPIKKSQPHQKEKPSLQKPKANKPKPNRDSTQTKNVKPVQKRFPDISKPDKTRKNSSLDTHKQGQPPDQNKTSSQSLIFTLKFPPAVLKPTTHRPQVVNTTLSDTFSSNNSAFTPKQHENNQIKSIMKYNENPLPESDSNSESKHEEKDSITPDQDVESSPKKPIYNLSQKPKTELESDSVEKATQRPDEIFFTPHPAPNQTTAWPTQRPAVSRNISKLNQTAKLGQAPKQNPKFQKPGTGLNTKPNKNQKPGQPLKTISKLKPPRPGQKPHPGFTPIRDKFHKAQTNKTAKPKPPSQFRPPTRPTLKPPADTIQKPDPAVQPEPKLEIKSGTNPTQSSWTSSTIQTMSTTMQPTLGIVKKLAEETPSPLDNNPNASFKKTITEQPNNRINSTEMSKENFLPEPKSNPYTTSEEKRSQLVTSTAVWEIKPTQKTSTVHQNPKMIKEVESAAGPTSTPKPLEGLREVSGDNRPYEPKSKEESEPKLTPTLVQTTAWPTKRPTLRGNISKTNQTAKLGQAPKQKPKFQKPGTGLNTKTLIKFKPGQPPKTNPKLKPPGPGQKPPPGFTPFGDKFFKAQSNKTNLRPPYRSKPPPRPTLEPQSETNKRFNPAVQPQPKQVNKKVTDPTPISWISSVPFQNTNTNKPLTSGPVQQISEMTQSPWGSKNNLQNENFPSSPSNRIIISDMKPQKNNQAPVMPMTTKPNKVDSEIPQNIISSTIPGSTLSSGLPKYDSTSKMPHNVEKSPPATIVPSPSSKTTSTMHPDFRSASPTTPGLDPQTSADSAQELREKKDQVAAFPNNSQSPNRSPADEHPKQHPKATDGDETNKISTETTLTARRDCSDLLLLGEKQSGVYTVTPDPRSRSFSVFCDMELEGGGWTVLQRRLDGSVSFNRTWAEYRSGFGVLDGGEFWLGNNMIHLLTRDRNMVLRVELEDFNGIREHAQYQYFRVASEKLLYKLMVGGYSGTAGDALRFSRMYNHNNRAFTTPDKDNDRYPSGNCGAYYSSGWWFDACMAVNLNGKYYVGPYKGVRNGIFWGTWHNISREYYPNNERHSFKTVRMMTRPARFKP
ncbi:nascent polypeptide-associated complex subunit alpha, muscle-specific form [Oryzias melastigma]|uniref:Nascent polypeptide-associated complex subunit alpha, muscle-specific form-like n=1 Tax=Oryzias melastigma TaxID=30732 RepID=A0A3B3BT95_ORYME|nr:nascent polypeptide-associated complex subunit alpha, muscle-specific form [Oryzias melastigma]